MRRVLVSPGLELISVIALQSADRVSMIGVSTSSY